MGQKRQPEMDPFQPGRPCPACQAEGARPAHHERPVLIVFGAERPWPCSGHDGLLGAHMCTRCESCGYAWMESLPAGMTGIGSLARKTATGKDKVMAIRKTGAAADQTVQAEGGIVREGAHVPEWDDEDESALAAENDAADQDDV